MRRVTGELILKRLGSLLAFTVRAMIRVVVSTKWLVLRQGIVDQCIWS